MASQKLADLKAAAFSSSEQGAIYVAQPTLGDEVALYQDELGTLPANKSGDPVKHLVDFSGNGNHAIQSGSDPAGLTLIGAPGDWRLVADATKNRPRIPAAALNTNTRIVGFSFVPTPTGRAMVMLGSGSDDASFFYVAYDGSSNTTIMGNAAFANLYSAGALVQPTPENRNGMWGALAGGYVSLDGVALSGNMASQDTRLFGYSGSGFIAEGEFRGLVVTDNASARSAVDTFLQSAYDGTLEEGTPPTPEPEPSEPTLTGLKAAAFGASERGIIYVAQPKLGGIVALYQDAAGTISATAAGDPVKYLVDFSGNEFHAIQPSGTAGLTLRGSPGAWYLEADNTSNRPIIPADALNSLTKEVGWAYSQTGTTRVAMFGAEGDNASVHYIALEGSTNSTINLNTSYTGYCVGEIAQSPLPADRDQMWAALTSGTIHTFQGVSYTSTMASEPTLLLGYAASGWESIGDFYGMVATEATSVTADIESFLIAARDGTLSEEASAPPTTQNVDHILVAGQSLAAGYLSTPGLTLTQPYENVMGDTGVFNGPVDSSGIDGPPNATSLVPLVFTSQNSGLGETIGIGGANFARHLLQGGNRLGVSSHAKGGRPINDLSKGTNFYNWGLQQVSNMRQLVQAGSNAYSFKAIWWMQGETDITSGVGNNRLAYKNALKQYVDDFNADANQLEPAILFTYQVACHPSRGSNPTGRFPPNIALAQADAAKEHANIYMVCPMYFCEYLPDNLHLPNHSERWVGQYFGKVYHKVVNLGEVWEPLQIKDAEQFENKVLLTYQPDVGPIAFDTTRVTAAPNMGFTATESNGQEVSITQVSLRSATEILLLVDTTEPVTIRYAWGEAGNSPGPVTGARGNLRDSDTTVSMYNDGDGQPYELFNWAIIDEFQARSVSVDPAPDVEIVLGTGQLAAQPVATTVVGQQTRSLTVGIQASPAQAQGASADTARTGEADLLPEPAQVSASISIYSDKVGSASLASGNAATQATATIHYVTIAGVGALQAQPAQATIYRWVRQPTPPYNWS